MAPEARPLSQRERRILADIEQTLSEDQKLARHMARGRPGGRLSRIFAFLLFRRHRATAMEVCLLGATMTLCRSGG